MCGCRAGDAGNSNFTCKRRIAEDLRCGVEVSERVGCDDHGRLLRLRMLGTAVRGRSRRKGVGEEELRELALTEGYKRWLLNMRVRVMFREGRVSSKGS